MQDSEIDPTSKEGEEIYQFDGGVDFKNVTFSYPSRPNIPVMPVSDTPETSLVSTHTVGPKGL